MKNTLVVVADIGCYKAFKMENGRRQRTRHLELVEEFNNAQAHEKLVSRVSDLAGRFHSSNGKSGGTAMSDGERHNIELEQRRRLVRDLAERLNTLDRGRDAERWLLAASREINHVLVNQLEPQIRAKIEKNIPADLTKLEQKEILKRF